MDNFVKRPRDTDSVPYRSKPLHSRAKRVAHERVNSAPPQLAKQQKDNFVCGTGSLSEKLASVTHGLVTADEFRRRREELEQEEREGPQRNAEKAKQAKLETRKRIDEHIKKQAKTLSFSMDD